MKQPNTQRLRALRLSALARDNKVVNAIRSSITQAPDALVKELMDVHGWLSLIHISEPTRLGMISYAVFCLKKKN